MSRMSSRKVVATKVVQYAIVFILAMIQISFTLVSLTTSPIQVVCVKDDTSFTETLTCPIMPFVYQFIYTLLLSVACCIQAFRARKLPTHYNETKYIVFAMMANIIIITVFLVSYAPIDAVNNDRIHFVIFQAVFISNTILLIILHGYKIWIILFRPMKNVDSAFKLATFNYFIQKRSTCKR